METQATYETPQTEATFCQTWEQLKQEERLPDFSVLQTRTNRNGHLVGAKANTASTLGTRAIKTLIETAAHWGFKLEISRSGAGLKVEFKTL